MKKIDNGQKRYWDSVANDKNFTIPLKFDFFREYVTKDALILDVGCGYGRTLHELRKNGYRNLTGVDFSLKMIERGKKMYPDIDLKVVDGRLPFEEQSFDVIILIAVLTCIESDWKQQQLVDNIRSILKPGGILYISDFLLNNDKRNKERYVKYKTLFKNYGTFKLPGGAIVRHHNKEWIFALLKKFTILNFYETEYVTMNGNISKGFYYFGEK